MSENQDVSMSGAIPKDNTPKNRVPFASINHQDPAPSESNSSWVYPRMLPGEGTSASANPPPPPSGLGASCSDSVDSKECPHVPRPTSPVPNVRDPVKLKLMLIEQLEYGLKMESDRAVAHELGLQLARMRVEDVAGINPENDIGYNFSMLYEELMQKYRIPSEEQYFLWATKEDRRTE